MIPEEKGWMVVPDVIKPPLLDRLLIGLAVAREECYKVQVRNGVADETDGTVHHLLAIRSCFVDLIGAMEVLDPIFTGYFGGKYILNSLGGAINARGHSSYAQRIHRDVRTRTAEPQLLNTLVMLDDFTVENGATWLGTASEVRPSEKVFFCSANRAYGTAGSVLIFNSNLWHCGGENRTDWPRRSLTPMFSRPWIKPQFDHCRALGYDCPGLSEYERQVIGFNARIPANHDEWYRKPEERFYRGDQG